MSDARSSIEAILFKPATGGFIYRAPNPWVFGTADHFLVDEAQKHDILEIVVARRPILRLAAITVALLLWGIGIGTLCWAFSGHEDPTAADVVVMIVMTIVAMFVALHAAIRRKLRRLQPILAGLPRSNERITSAELRKAMTGSISLKAALWTGILWTVTCLSQIFVLVIRNDRHPLLADAQSWTALFLLTAAALLAARHFHLAVRRAGRRQMTA